MRPRQLAIRLVALVAFVAAGALGGAAAQAKLPQRKGASAPKAKSVTPAPLPAPTPAPAPAPPAPGPVGGTVAGGGTAAAAPGGKKLKTFDFTAMGIEGKVLTPQLLYLLGRIKVELEKSSLASRSFISELVRSVDEGGL